MPKKAAKKVPVSLASRNAAATYAGGIRTGNERHYSRHSEPVRCENYKKANIHAWAPHPPPRTSVPHRTANPVFPKLKKGAKVLRAIGGWFK